MSPAEQAQYIEHLETKVAELEGQINDLQVEIKRIKKEKGMSSLLDNFSFNDRTGTHVESASGKHFCTKCLLENEKRNPLKTEPHGWRCMVCKKYYGDPDRPEVVDYGDSGPDSWLGR